VRELTAVALTDVFLDMKDAFAEQVKTFTFQCTIIVLGYKSDSSFKRDDN
jgi:hypothetical protein